ncbi:MAG TPA: hypothetical protein VGU25_00800 [Acidobacteriaceae bacterium]|nr:hypothetical protein [Acidobacteriaceae bacterium]
MGCGARFDGGPCSGLGGGVSGGAAEFGFVFAVALELGRIDCVEIFEEELHGAFGFIVAELGGWGEEAVFGVVDDFADRLFGFGVGIGLGQVEASDLEAVEEQPRAARVDFVGGDLLENDGEALLDGAAVFGIGDSEAGLAALARGGVLNGAAGVVVEVAEGQARLGATFGAAEGGAAAAAAVGEDVAALEAGFVFGGLVFGCHGVSEVLGSRFQVPGSRF